jgi:hypothetical protein
MNATTDIIQVRGYKVVGASDEGKCDRCGKEGLKRTVAVQAVDADGLGFSEAVEHWGVCCAAYAKFGSKSYASQSRVMALASNADMERAYELSTRPLRIADTLTVTRKVMFPFSHTETDTFDCLRGAANAKYRRSNRTIEGSYFASNAQGHIVRVDGKDAADVAFFAARGFYQITTAVEA